VFERIGSGGMGTVWLAEDINLGRRVVLKFLTEDLARNQAALERFKLEARTASSLNHPNICTIYEVGEAEGEYFIAMEYIEGEGLDRYLLHHRLDTQEILDLGLQIVDALDAAHSGGIVHRDIKPANILVTPRGKVKVLDFGLAKLVSDRRRADQPTYVGATMASAEHLTSPGMAVGTTAFMSPEQARGQELDARSDLFSLGAVLYEMSTGRLPFDGGTAAVIFDGILNRDPVPPIELNPGLPPKLDEIIRIALEKDRDLRYQSAAEMRAELKRLKRDTSSGRVPLLSVPASGASAAATHTASSQATEVRPRGRKLLLLGAIAAVVVVGGVLGSYYWLHRPHAFNLQNMRIVQVTTSGNAGASALSPDRRYIVYALHDGALESLWVQQLATGSNIQVLAPEQAHYVALSFTPDGNYIMFVRSDKSTQNFRYLYQLPVLGGTPKQLVRDIDSAPSFSPDGRQIAYVRGTLNPPGNDFLVANADGSGERVLARRPGFAAGLGKVDWSPDGKLLALTSPETRDGRTRWMLETASLGDGEVHDVRAFPVQMQAVAWLPDSSGLLVVGVDPQSGRGQIWSVSYPGGDWTRFTNDLSNYDSCCLDITRDGDALVALQNSLLSDIWVAKADGSSARQITSAEPLGLSLDWIGNRIVAVDSQLRWFTLNSDGGNRTALAGDREPHLDVSACQDGKHLVYTTYHNSNVELWRSETDGSNAIQLVPHTVIGGAFCMPDSKSAIYATDQGMWRVSINGGTPEKMQLPLALMRFSEDGKLFAYLDQGIEGGTMHSELVVMDAAAGTPLHKFAAPYGMRNPRFTPDGKALAFLLTRQGATNIWEQPLSGGDLVQITRFAYGDMFAFAWSADGKQLAFSRGQRKSDVVMMSGFR
jgi:eukaryotic-like serine/threonine-protein kinase